MVSPFMRACSWESSSFLEKATRLASWKTKEETTTLALNSPLARMYSATNITPASTPNSSGSRSFLPLNLPRRHARQRAGIILTQHRFYARIENPSQQSCVGNKQNPKSKQLHPFTAQTHHTHQGSHQHHTKDPVNCLLN